MFYSRLLLFSVEAEFLYIASTPPRALGVTLPQIIGMYSTSFSTWWNPTWFYLLTEHLTSACFLLHLYHESIFKMIGWLGRAGRTLRKWVALQLCSLWFSALKDMSHQGLTGKRKFAVFLDRQKRTGGCLTCFLLYHQYEGLVKLVGVGCHSSTICSLYLHPDWAKKSISYGDMREDILTDFAYCDMV